MLAIVAAFLAQTAYNLLVWRRADELMRQTISQTGAVCFWVLQGLLFLWAAAEKLNIAPALSAWDMMTLMMGFYLIVSSAMSMRRGLT
jgi:TRAP-type C4-dicarboxylate transport system permease large subunit